MTSQPPVHDNQQSSRYEIDVAGQIAVAEYSRDGSTVTFTHTFVPEPLRDHGLATRLIEAALDDARRARLEVVPQCRAFADYMKAHPATQDLLGPEGRALLGI